MSDTPEMLSVRECTERDIPLLCSLEKICFLEDAWCADAFSESLENPACKVYLVSDGGGNNVAYCVIYTVLDECDIANIAVLPEYRRRGYGRNLLEYMLEVCRLCDVKKVFLDVRESNTPARRLYEKCGFVEIGRRKWYYSSPREDAVEMMKVLSDDNTCS